MKEQPGQPVQENLWWLIPEKLAGVRKLTLKEIAELQTAEGGAIVSFMDDPSNLDLYQKVGLPYVWLPMWVCRLSEIILTGFQYFWLFFLQTK